MKPELKTFAFYSFPTELDNRFTGDGFSRVFLGNKPDFSSDPDFFEKMDFFEGDAPTEYTELNDLLNESTGIAWIGRNLDRVGNPDFVGTAHYRRFLEVEKSKLHETRILCHLERQPFNIFRTYSMYHVADDLRTFNTMFSRKNQEYAPSLNDFMNGSAYASRNMFVMSNEMFRKYCRFQGKCLEVLSEMARNTDFRKRDKYQKRAIGFIMERMTGFWIYNEARNGVEVSDCQVIDTGSESPYQREAGG